VSALLLCVGAKLLFWACTKLNFTVAINSVSGIGKVESLATLL